MRLNVCAWGAYRSLTCRRLRIDIPVDRKSTRLNSSHQIISYAAFFFNDTATTEIYTLSLHDALPISLSPEDLPVSGKSGVYMYPFALVRALALTWVYSGCRSNEIERLCVGCVSLSHVPATTDRHSGRSEEHTSELQSPDHLVCRLLF